MPTYDLLWKVISETSCLKKDIGTDVNAVQ